MVGSTSDALSLVTPTITSPCSAYLAYVSLSAGTMRLQGPHQVRQKSRSTTRPRRSARLEAPAGKFRHSTNSMSGAACPTSRAAAKLAAGDGPDDVAGTGARPTARAVPVRSPQRRMLFIVIGPPWAAGYCTGDGAPRRTPPTIRTGLQNLIMHRRPSRELGLLPQYPGNRPVSRVGGRFPSSAGRRGLAPNGVSQARDGARRSRRTRRPRLRFLPIAMKTTVALRAFVLSLAFATVSTSRVGCASNSRTRGCRRTRRRWPSSSRSSRALRVRARPRTSVTFRRPSSPLAALRLLRVSSEYASSACLARNDDGSPKRDTCSRTGPKLTFNVYIYNEDMEAFSKKPVELHKKTRKKALAFVKGTKLSGNKDLWACLEAVLDDPDIDTVYMLTSGEPDVGLYVHGNRISENLADINRFQNVVVHAVAYSKEGYWRHIRAIAEATGGQFEGFQ
ncbi:MAG: hypothetical protein E2O39_12280 [Planctomycetota bacterium]|nr:MAG: hypothetical protein E2O39_12280 [Planctomycetota bacterium]